MITSEFIYYKILVSKHLRVQGSGDKIYTIFFQFPSSHSSFTVKFIGNINL